jgi:glutathionylspermidine synthase
MIIKIAYSLLLKYPSGEFFNHKNILSIYKLYIRQILIKSIQNHTLNAKEIIDRRTGKYIKPSYTFLTNSRNSPNHMTKTIFNNLINDVNSLIKSLCENQSNNTNDIVNKNQIKKGYK